MIIYAFISKDDSIISVNIHDTYYVMGKINFYKFYAAFFLVLSLLYLFFDITKFKLYEVLNVIHIYGVLILFVLLNYFNYQDSLANKAINFNVLLNQVDYGFYVILTLLATIFLQILFIINIFVALIKNSGT